MMCISVRDEMGNMPQYHNAMPARFHVTTSENDEGINVCFGCLGEFLAQCGNDLTKYPVTINYLEE